MPWEEKVIVTMREEFVKRVLSHEKSKAELCREYGISRPAGNESYAAVKPLKRRNCLRRHAAVSA